MKAGHVSNTRIMKDANVSTGALQNYLNLLVSGGYVRETTSNDETVFGLTEKGFSILQTVHVYLFGKREQIKNILASKIAEEVDLSRTQSNAQHSIMLRTDFPIAQTLLAQQTNSPRSAQEIMTESELKKYLGHYGGDDPERHFEFRPINHGEHIPPDLLGYVSEGLMKESVLDKYATHLRTCKHCQANYLVHFFPSQKSTESIRAA